MTRKHYIKIAELLAKTNASQKVIDGMIDLCLEDNPRFDLDRFKNYIGEIKSLQKVSEELAKPIGRD
tara:strand:- start:889 stop:1089 length:201 start_codon:yes stop_codon:yes gene_type:complete